MTDLTEKRRQLQNEKSDLKRNRITFPILLAMGVALTITVAGIWYFANQDLTNTQPQNGSPTSLPSSFITVAFDFDTGSPFLITGQSVPFNQTKDGVTAFFSSPSGTVFSVGNDNTTSFKMSRFSGNYLYDTTPTRDILDIKFDARIISINFTFATVESCSEDLTIPSDIWLTLYENVHLIGTTETYGNFSGDSYPQGEISFKSGEPFNWARVSIPAQTSGTTDFLIDNLVVVANRSQP